jgi:hypothetical protein
MMGSCQDNRWLATIVEVRCSDAQWKSPPSSGSQIIGGCDAQSRCCPSSLVRVRASSALGSDAATAWQRLQSLPQADWLPQSGVLTGVSVSVANADWRNIVASQSPGVSNKKYVLDSTMESNTFSSDRTMTPEVASSGRSAGAFARVACHQLGFRYAALVTTCGALRKAATAATATNISMAKRLTEVTSAVCPPAVSSLSGKLRQKNDMCNAAPFMLYPKHDRPTQFEFAWLQRISDWQNNVSRPMATIFGETKPVDSCSCDGTESSVTACYAACVYNWNAHKLAPCDNTVLVGCSNESGATSGTVPARAGSIDHERTWVVGDRGSDPLSARPRKVFSFTDGPYNCTTRHLMGVGSGQGGHMFGNVAERNRWLLQLCWGVLVPN